MQGDEVARSTTVFCDAIFGSSTVLMIQPRKVCFSYLKTLKIHRSYFLIISKMNKITYVFSFGLGIFISAFAFAVQGIGVSAPADSPANQNGWFVYDLESGESRNGTVLVRNTTDRDVTANIYPADQVVSSGGGFALKQKTEPMNGIGSWLKLAKEKTIVKAGASEEIPFKIAIPANVQDTKLAGAIMIEEAAQNDSQGGGIKLSTRSGVRVYNADPTNFNNELVAAANAKEAAKSERLLAAAPPVPTPSAPTPSLSNSFKADLLAAEPKPAEVTPPEKLVAVVPSVVPVPSMIPESVVEEPKAEPAPKLLASAPPAVSTPPVVIPEPVSMKADLLAAKAKPVVAKKVDKETIAKRMADYYGLPEEVLKADLQAQEEADPFSHPKTKIRSDEELLGAHAPKELAQPAPVAPKKDFITIIKGFFSSFFGK